MESVHVHAKSEAGTKEEEIMRYLIGIDIGTSATKTVLFDEKCHVVTSASQEYPLYQPQNGWAEQEPLDWYNAVLVTIRKVVKDSGVPAEDIKGIGLSGQMHGLVMLDKDNAVIRPSIIWCDQRTGKECEEITERVGRERLIEITANPALTGFTASKILWVRNHEAENYRRCFFRKFFADGARDLRRFVDLRQQSLVDVEFLEDLIRPAAVRDIQELHAARIGYLRRILPRHAEADVILRQEDVTAAAVV